MARPLDTRYGGPLRPRSSVERSKGSLNVSVSFGLAVYWLRFGML